MKRVFDAGYWRKVALVFSVMMVFVWGFLGFDSGVGMLEEALKALASGKNIVDAAYEVYGVTFHFSSYVIYGVLFAGLSRHFEGLGLKGAKNLLYSAFLVMFNIGAFEMWYMAMFAKFQMGRGLVEWFTSDFWEAPVATNFCFTVLGVVTLLYFFADSYKLENGETVGKNYTFKLGWKPFAILGLAVAVALLWIYYPFKVETLSIGDWTSSPRFPQTHYAYMMSDVHVANTGVHLVNVVVKALFAVVQWTIFSSFRRVIP